MNDEVIIEVGSGSGRFTEQAASTGAMVLSVDSSQAVDANYASNKDKVNVLVVQADLYRMPFAEHSCDRLFCFGVLQHTPNPEGAFLEIVKYLKPGGSLVIDVYRRIPVIKSFLFAKYLVRPLTRRIPPDRLYHLCERYVEIMWPITGALNRIHNGASGLLLVADYRGTYSLPSNLMKEWALLDTFDMLSPAYDEPQTVEAVRNWFQVAHLANVEIHYGYAKIDARAIKTIDVHVQKETVTE